MSEFQIVFRGLLVISGAALVAIIVMILLTIKQNRYINELLKPKPKKHVVTELTARAPEFKNNWRKVGKAEPIPEKINLGMAFKQLGWFLFEAIQRPNGAETSYIIDIRPDIIDIDENFQQEYGMLGRAEFRFTGKSLDTYLRLVNNCYIESSGEQSGKRNPENSEENRASEGQADSTSKA